MTYSNKAQFHVGESVSFDEKVYVVAHYTYDELHACFMYSIGCLLESIPEYALDRVDEEYLTHNY